MIFRVTTRDDSRDNLLAAQGPSNFNGVFTDAAPPRQVFTGAFWHSRRQGSRFAMQRHTHAMAFEAGLKPQLQAIGRLNSVT